MTGGTKQSFEEGQDDGWIDGLLMAFSIGYRSSCGTLPLLLF